MQDANTRITVAIDEKAVRRLLRNHIVSLEEMHGTNRQARERLRSLLLDLLRQELAC